MIIVASLEGIVAHPLDVVIHVKQLGASIKYCLCGNFHKM